MIFIFMEIQKYNIKYVLDGKIDRLYSDISDYNTNLCIIFVFNNYDNSEKKTSIF